MTASQRRKAYQRGHRAELIAGLYLNLKGYRIVARRFKTPVGEVDLIARRRTQVLFVEVKARSTAQAALDAVSRTAENRIDAAGEWWLSRQNDYHRLSWRCDVIAVSPWRWPQHFKNVW